LRDLAAKRMQEARTAAALLGLPAERQFFLGYPDRGLLKLLTDNYATPYHSKYTAAASVPYDTALFPGHPYTGASLERDFEAVRAYRTQMEVMSSFLLAFVRTTELYSVIPVRDAAPTNE